MDKIIEALNKGIEKAGVERQKVCLVTDIAYSPEVVDFLGIDLFHTTRGRAIPYATGMKLANPKLLPVVLFGDIATLGGNHFVHSCRRNIDIVLICVNDFVYREVGGETAPGDFPPISFSPYLSFEKPLNIPHMARSCGCVNVSRWTALHTNELTDSISHALQRTGLSLIDVISSVPDLLEFYYKNSELRNDEDTLNVAIEKDKKIIVGNFFNDEKPSFIEAYNEQHAKMLGDNFVKIEVE
jgi:2-oxoglutarate ferredoxin oxidoreductase subunit beta